MATLGRLRVTGLPLSQIPIRRWRAFGSAAAVQIDDYYDYYEEDERAAHGVGDHAAEESERLSTGRGVQWVIIGDPFARRHVYAARLAKLLDVPHISMGNLVRQELHPHSSLYKQIASAVNQGKLVDEQVTFTLLSRRLEEGYSRGENGFILDGIPRTRVQAEILDQVVDIDLVVNLKCSEEYSLKKPLGSRIYSPAQELLTIDASRFNLNLQTSDGHSKFSTSDVNGVWKEKLRLYAEQSKPLEEYYKKQKKLLDFQIAGAPGESWQGLLAALHLQHMGAMSASQKLTA